jgi:hypothetical protein
MQAKAASRVAAELSSMQVLLLLPYAEVLCFADTTDTTDSSSSSGAAQGNNSGHR